MQEQSSRSTPQLIFGLITAAIAWWAVIFQGILRTGTLANFLSFFTVETNLLIAICLTVSLLFPKTAAGRFFSGAPVQTAIALYIFIVALVYNTVLRGLVPLSGWNIVLDNTLHVGVPVLYLLYWYFFVPHQPLKWRDGIYWLLFPAAYLVYSLIRGSMVNWYPYPFLNAGKLGYPAVMLNIGGMLVAFLLGGLLLIALHNRRLQVTQNFH